MSNEQTGWQQTSDLMARIAQLEVENARLREALQVADTYVDGLQFFEGADVATIWSVQGVIRHALKISDDANTGGKEEA